MSQGGQFFMSPDKDLLPALRPCRTSRATQPSLGSACLGSQEAAGVETGVTAFGGWVPSDLWRFLPLAVLRTCLAEMVFLPTRFFFASAIAILLSKEAEDTCGADAYASFWGESEDYVQFRTMSPVLSAHH